MSKKVKKQEKEIVTQLGRPAAPITCPEHLKHLTAKQIAEELPSKLVRFGLAVAHGKNKTQAYKEHIAREGSTNKANSASSSKLVKNNTWVQGLIAKTEQELHAKLQHDLMSDSKRWCQAMLAKGNAAQADKQHGPSIRALELVGKATGVLNVRNEPTHDKNVYEALAQIAGSNASLAKSLAHQLGLKLPEIVDGEFDEKP